VDVGMMMHPLQEKRTKDSTRYVALCPTSRIAFRRAIDVLPKSSTRRIHEMKCNVAKGDAQLKFSPKQRRLCSKYVADVRASSKTKRRLLRSANKEAVRPVLAPLLLQTAFGTTDGRVTPTNCKRQREEDRATH
jgi:hypothetical protein